MKIKDHGEILSLRYKYKRRQTEDGADIEKKNGGMFHPKLEVMLDS
jgi:hypothetical protein